MRHVALAALVCALGAAAPAGAQEPVDQAMIAQIKTEAMQHSHVAGLFDHLVNVIGPRLTNSPAFREAVAWSAEQLRRAGLAHVHTEAWPFGRGWALERLTVEITAPYYAPLIGYAEGWTPSTRGALQGTPVYVGDLTADEIRALRPKLAGRIVLPWKPQTAFITRDRAQPTDATEPVHIGAPPYEPTLGPVDRRAMPALMREIGAGAVLQPSQGNDGTVFVLGNRRTPDDAAPTVVLAAEHYNRIVRMLQAGAPVTLRVDVRTRYYAADTNATNVIAELPGSDPSIGDEVVMLGAHLDSWHAGTGATDNADGVVTLIEAARILTALGVHPRRTIRFALWGGEEQGLLGSRAYVAQHLAGDAHAAERARFDVYLNNDPGTGPTYGWYLEQNAAVRPIFDAWLAPLEDVGARRNVMDKIGATDHLSFIAVGLPGFNTVQDYTHYDTRTHHTNMDVYERVNVDDLKEVAAVLATFAYEAAMRDAMIPRASGPAPGTPQ